MTLSNQRKMSTILSALISLTLISSCLAQVATLCETTHEYDYDSGRRRNAFTRVRFNDAGTIQLDLTQTKLAPGAKLVLTGNRNDSYQELNDQSLQALNGWSDAIDGNQVTVELIGPTGMSIGIATTKSRVVISGFKTDTCIGGDDVTSSSICGDVDDRIASQDVRAGRIGGCTGWLISEDVFIQAGHCGTPSSSTRIHFTYGVSNAPVQDQYAVDVSSYVGVNGGVGNDWGVGRLLPNSSTGKLPGVAQSEKCGSPGCGWYTLGTVPSSTSGNNIRVTGYGTAAVDSRSQKTHVGPLTSMTTTALRYRPDTTGGNSGSPVIHEETGHAIGVHTHGGCSASGGSNAGTRVDRAEFAAAVDALLSGVSPTPAPTPACQQSDFQLNLLTDNYPSETTWTLTNNCSGGQVASGGPYSSSGTAYTETACVPAGEYTFTINDSYGDGICCGYGSGSFSIEYEGSTVVPNGGEFSSTISHTFGSCGNSSTNPPFNPPTNPPTSPPTLMPTIAPTLVQDLTLAEGQTLIVYMEGDTPSLTITVEGGNFNVEYEK